MIIISTFILFLLLEVVISQIEGSIIDGIVPFDCQRGIPEYPSNKMVKFILYGQNLKPGYLVGITKYYTCENILPINLEIEPGSEGSLGSTSFTSPPSGGKYLENVGFYFCLLLNDSKWVHQDLQGKPAFYVFKPVMTPLIYFILVAISFTLSCLMSGLNIGLLSLDLNELQILKNAGTSKEKKYAKKIIPVRKRGNYLLCSIVITATMCNAISTVIIERFLVGWRAVLISTCLIVLIGEVIPQSVCTYAPLAIGAHTVYITIAVMALTAPASYPLALVLNLLLGKEIVKIYTEERLKELFKMIKLPTNQEKIILGALELKKKRVEEIMTPLDDIFELSIDAVLDYDTINSIINSGFSRIPIYVGNKSNICYLLLTKELIMINPTDNIPVKTLLKSSERTCLYLQKGNTLDVAFTKFKDSRVHMAFIVGGKMAPEDVVHQVIGLITFEDVIEEIFQQEIIDETDIFVDNRYKQKITEFDRKLKKDLVSKPDTNKTVIPSESIKLATFYFLTTAIDLFSNQVILPNVLNVLLGLDVFYEAPGKCLPQDNLYLRGKPADYFIMIIEGLMEIKYGKKELSFEAGPFKYFGQKALHEYKTKSPFSPEFSLTAIKKSVYLKITQEMYEAAILATQFVKNKKIPKVDNKSNVFKLYEKIIKFE